ncbi:MAG: LacI family DNA-binding transcriptional regulator [Rhodospirillum sp.]|nr:LacI family DNA-binding transcriptional regulator [Rhodospirillum sp.]MCF8489441.1 LacI family DNA-binding transcriptional regulator [Rhodospirillum sp.]MCF8500955.1 LacI family DNA-binding transcriptional regulator [Rhodospirillum sp.]
MSEAANQTAPKLVDVARLAECSISTVSRVLNDNPTVGKSERERVLKAIAQLGYVPNGSARALRSSRTRLVGAIIPTLDHAIYAVMVNGLESRLSEEGVSLIINTSDYDADKELKQARLLIERGVEAIVLVGACHNPKLMPLLDRAGVGHVFTYTTRAHEGGAAIGFDNVKGGVAGARFLHDLGHVAFAMIAGVTKDNDRARERIDGFLGELDRLGHDTATVAVAEARYDLESGRHAMSQLMRRPRRPTAVFCGSDILAAGALKYCRAEGIDVPGDVSVMGFDNLEIAELTTPELTTLEVPARSMGTYAAEYALADSRRRTQDVHRELALRLIVRGSTGPCHDGPGE